MSEPSDEELERAERIRKLRSGGGRSRGHEMRERRRDARDAAESEETETASADGDADRDAEGEAADGETDSSPGPMPGGGDVDVLSMAEALPEDGSLFVVPLREELRREFNKVAEQLHLRYGFEFESELDAEQHVRPLALFLGIQSLEDTDVEVVKELLKSVDELEAPDDGSKSE